MYFYTRNASPNLKHNKTNIDNNVTENQKGTATKNEILTYNNQIMKNFTIINFFSSALAALAKSKGYAIAAVFLLAVVGPASAQNGMYVLNNSHDPGGISVTIPTAPGFKVTPFATKERNMKQQYLYKRGEFHTAVNQTGTYPLGTGPKQIKSLAFNVTQFENPALWGVSTIYNYKIKIGNYAGDNLGVNNESFTPFGAQWTSGIPAAVTGQQFVMDIPVLTITELGWKEIELIDNITGLGFQWDGVSNIIVEVSIYTPAGQPNNVFQQQTKNVLVSGTTWNSTNDRRTVGAITNNKGILTGGSGHDYVQGPPVTNITDPTNNAAYLSQNDRRFRPDIRFRFACADGTNVNPHAYLISEVLPTNGSCRVSTIGIRGATNAFGAVYEWERSLDVSFLPATTETLPETTPTIQATQTNVDVYYRRITVCDGQRSPSDHIVVAAATINTYTIADGWSAGAPDNSGKWLDIQGGSPTLSQDATACGCNIAGGVNVIVESGKTLHIDGNLNIAASGMLTMMSGSSLLQNKIDPANLSRITVERITTPMVVYDYTYYGSPVQDATLVGFSPNTLSDKYYKWNPVIQNWALVAPSSTMVPGQGYIIRAPQGWTAAPLAYTGHFVGKPNNGDITANIMTGAASMNMVVNPYPSPLDLDAFQAENSAKLDGTYYFWTHKTAINATTHQYAANDFAVYNNTGGTQAVPGGVVPTGKVAVGQGFMVKGKGAAVAADVVTYKNSMRLPATTQAHFYKAAANSVVDVNAPVKNRVWLNFTGSTAFKQILVGYLDGATEEYDNGYDGEISADANVSFYSILGNKQLGIQGKGLPFNVSDVVPLGFKVNSAGTYKIELNNFDGVFATQDVYLVDKMTNVTHNLKGGAYEFITTPGTHDERFEITYVSLSLQLGVASNGNTGSATDFVAFKQENNLVVTAGSAEIDMVRVYDLSGRMLIEKKGENANDVLISNPNWASQVLIVQMHTVDKLVLTKKVVF